jgi:aminoglycoside phosphotransferase (APT) family kinase protein
MSDAIEVEQAIKSWIENNIGCEVVSMERQARWRPCWYVDARLPSGEAKSLYVRGERSILLPEGRTPLSESEFRTEYEIMCVLEAEGILVPHVYGLCPEPLAMVTDRASGRGDLSTADSDEERAAVLGEYMDMLAKVHAIDASKFDGIALPRPESTGSISLARFDRAEREYRKKKQHPDPLVEFLIKWIRLNEPKHRKTVSFLVHDPAQFMFEDGKLTALIDFELAYLGDALQDLAGLQLRNTSEPLGDIPRALRRYEAATGKPIDAGAFDFHTIAFATGTPMSLSHRMLQGLPTANMVQYLEWRLLLAKLAIELIAGTTGRSLPESEGLQPDAVPLYDAFAQSLVGAIGKLPVEEGYGAHEQANTVKLAEFVARAQQFDAVLQRRDREDVEALLGRPFATLLDADWALEKFVLEAGPEADDLLVPLFYARVLRHWELFLPFIHRASVDTTAKTFEQLMA